MSRRARRGHRARNACRAVERICIVSDSHEAEVRRQAHVLGGHSWLVNPGTVAGLDAPAATWILGDLDTMTFEIRPTPD